MKEAPGEQSRSSVWLGSAAAVVIGLPILLWGILQPGAPILPWFVPVCDTMAIVCMVVVATLGSLDAVLRRNRRSLPIIFIAAATAAMWAGHFVIFPGDLPAVHGQNLNQGTSTLFLAINLLTPLLLSIALLQRAGALERPPRSILLATTGGGALAVVVIGFSLTLGAELDTVSSTGRFNAADALVGFAGLIPAAIGLVAFLMGRHGDERIAAGVLAALTFTALNSISLVFLHQRYTPSWYADHVLGFLPFAALLAGQLWLYTGSVMAERKAAGEAALAAERHRIGLDIAKAMARETDLMPVVDRLLFGVMEALSADRVTMLRLSPEGFVVERSADREGRPAHIGAALSLDSVKAGDREVVREAVEQRRPIAYGAYRVAGLDGPEVSAHASILQSVATPLLRAGDVDGVLIVGRRTERPFTAADVEQLEELSTIATLLIRNSRLLADAEWSSRAKSNFINLAAHELGTPISVIRGYVEMLADQSLGPISQVQRGPLEAVRGTSAELAERVEQLLVASRLESGVRSAASDGTSLIDLNAAVREAVRRATDRARLVGADVTTLTPPHAVEVTGSGRDIGMILDNLINNAMTYSRPPAKVRVEVSTPGAAEIRVADDGIGIPDHARERIFDQFYRVDDVEFGYPSGTGLGLYISRGLAERNGGELFLERSAPGEGSVFVLRLQRAGRPMA